MRTEQSHKATIHDGQVSKNNCTRQDMALTAHVVLLLPYKGTFFSVFDSAFRHTANNWLNRDTVLTSTRTELVGKMAPYFHSHLRFVNNAHLYFQLRFVNNADWIAQNSPHVR